MDGGRPRECEKLRERLVEHVEGALAGGDLSRVDEHLAACARCRRELDDLRTVMAAVRGIPPGEMRPELVSRVRQAVRDGALRGRTAQQFWTRLAVPVAVVTGIIAVSFALRPAVRGPRPAETVRDGASRAVVPPPPSAEAPPASPGRLEVASRRGGGPGGQPGWGATAPPAPALHEEALSYAPAPPAARADLRSSASDAAGAEESAQTKVQEEAYRPVDRYRRPLGPSAPTSRSDSIDRQSPDAEPARGPRRGRASRAGEAGPVAPHLLRRPAESAEPMEKAVSAGEPEDAPAPPFRAKAILARGEGRSLVALQVLTDQPVAEIALTIGVEGAERKAWRGTPPMPGAIVLSADDTGPGPAAIPLRLESPQGRREYTLFVPVMARLGESAPAAPTGRLEGKPLFQVLADFSALTGLVLLAEEPLSARVCGEIPAGAPGASLEKMATRLGYDVHREGDLVFTLERRRSSD